MSTSEHDVTEHPREELPTERPGGRHPVNVGHLVMGVAFVGLVVVWGLVRSETVHLRDAGWILGLPWLAAGAAGLLATALRHRGTADQGSSGTMHGWQ